MTAHTASGPKGMPKAAEKYHPYPPVDLADRTWPSKQITKAPIWCSVDLARWQPVADQPDGA
jgi:2-isopropylmalate synthase